MHTIMLSPSLMVGNLMDINSDLKEIQKSKINFLHIDLLDPSVGSTTGLPPALIPELRNSCNIPLDIHIASRYPEKYLDTILPHCENCYVSIHAEHTDHFLTLANQIRNAGAKPGIAINSSSSVQSVEHFFPVVDLITLLTFDAGQRLNIPGVKDYICRKITEARQICEWIGRNELLIECDGGITFDDVKRFSTLGANMFVLGRDSIFAQSESISIKIQQLLNYVN